MLECSLSFARKGFGGGKDRGGFSRGCGVRARVWAVGCLLVVGLGVAAFAGPLSGSLSVFGRFWDFQPLGNLDFDSHLEIDYTTCGWTLGAMVYFLLGDFEFLSFDAAGSVGAFNLYGVGVFDPTPGQVEAFLEMVAGSVRLSISGVEAYAVPVLSPGTWTAGWSDVFASGLLVGGWGIFADCSLWVQAQFNMPETNYLIAHEGYSALLAIMGPYPACDWYGQNYWWHGDWRLLPDQTGCCLCWSGINVILQAPFACLENLTTTIDFDCDEGFNYVVFGVEQVCLGLSWLDLGYLEVGFEVKSKELDWAFDLIVGDCLCFTPYLALDQQGTAVNGIDLEAITIEYDTSQGVLFKAGHRFADGPWYDYLDPYRSLWWGFTPWGEIVDDYTSDLFWCIWDDEFDEYIALEIDGDSCCGGLFDAWIYNWFDTDQTGAFMDWAETVIGLDIGIGSNTTLIFHAGLMADGIEFLDFGVKFLF